MFHKHKKKKKTKRIKKSNMTKLYILFILLIVVLLSSYSITLFNQRFLPSVIEIASINMQSSVNRIINDAITNTTQSLSLNSEDFYIKSVDNNGKVNSLSANTLLINEVCSQLAVDISDALSSTDVQNISIPVGSLLGIDIFANTGPKYNIKILPRGNATVDYETEFVAAGINQINYQIWLKIDSKMQIVNPMQDDEINITRKIALVNAVINGEVPPAYLNPMQKSD